MPISHCTSIYLLFDCLTTAGNQRTSVSVNHLKSTQLNSMQKYCLFKISLALKFEPCVDSIMLICIALGCFKVPTFFLLDASKDPELKSTAEFNNSNDSGRSIISCKTNIF